MSESGDRSVLADLLDSDEAHSMTDRQVSALATYLSLPVWRRSLGTLRRQLMAEYGDDVPADRTLERWSEQFGWQALAAQYEAARAHARSEREEREREEHAARVRASAIRLQSAAEEAAQRVIEEYLRPIGDPDTWPVNQRTGKPTPPRKTLSGLQAAAYAFKEAVQAERLALSLPTSVTSGKIEARTTTDGVVEHTVSIAEWRNRTRLAREEAARLAPPVVDAAAPRLKPSDLTPEQLAQLPYNFFGDEPEDEAPVRDVAADDEDDPDDE